ncbi:Monocarboxylate transporter 14 [Armadillidium vulgare]|nr:Monocarboxylate transporter 14 [Armadillidium vulgare]
MDSLESPSLTCNDSPPELSDTEQEQTPQANNSSNAKAVEMVPPDGGWGWMVVAGSFLIFSVGGYTLYAFSIFLSPILMSDQVSSIKIAWIFNFNHLILSFYTIFIGPLCEQFGTRKMAIFGGVASFLSLFLSAFAPTVDYLFFTYAVPAGIGLASTFTLTYMVVSTYFTKHRGFAIAMISVGDCLSGFISPVIANYLLENFGYISATAISGALVLNHLWRVLV